MNTRYFTALASVGVLSAVVAGCSSNAAEGPEPSAPDPAPAVTEAAPEPGPTPCAEFPPVGSLPGDVEGWWSSAPADADGNVLADPADWPEQMREHLRVALVDTGTATVISTYDRIACGHDDSYTPTPADDWPADAVVVVDMDTGEVITVLG